MTNIVVVQSDNKGARQFTRIAKLRDFVKNNGLHFKEQENGKEDRSALYNKEEKLTHVCYSFDHVNVVGKSDKTNPNAYHK